ncbi:hypothetical protein Scep_016413 [Stephania cephalantha]|uniref:Uncharacterized protein n=1 Tax=Stephania cephalantha TaxID=152367 RepID=A0AAP0INE9_9MAGN
MHALATTAFQHSFDFLDMHTGPFSQFFARFVQLFQPPACCQVSFFHSPSVSHNVFSFNPLVTCQQLTTAHPIRSCHVSQDLKQTPSIHMILLRARATLPPTRTNFSLLQGPIFEVPVHIRHNDLESIREVHDSFIWQDIDVDDYPSVDAATVGGVPVVDLNNPNAMKLMNHVCETWGVFQVVNHGVPLSSL